MTQGEISVDADGRVSPLWQTRIASFLMSAHGAHARRLALAVPGPIGTAWQAELHGQFCREMETISLLARATSWAFGPSLPLCAWRWEMAWLPRPVDGVADAGQATLIDTAAFGHALHAAIRPAAILPEQAAPLNPFSRWRCSASKRRAGGCCRCRSCSSRARILTAGRKAIESAVGFRDAQMRLRWQDMLASLA